MQNRLKSPLAIVVMLVFLWCQKPVKNCGWSKLKVKWLYLEKYNWH